MLKENFLHLIKYFCETRFMEIVISQKIIVIKCRKCNTNQSDLHYGPIVIIKLNTESDFFFEFSYFFNWPNPASFFYFVLF